ncbi:MAG: hypothetical protein JWQ97_1125 [Phenylobacterium sp.]|nr:hypothetical protein [Phenylobacterium sp.]
MIIDPFRWYRRHQRLVRESHDEAQYLRRRHGAEAVAAARAKLTRPDLTRWGRSVLELAVKELGRPPRET